MTLSQRLVQLDGMLEIHNENHWNEPLDNELDTYSSFNDAGVECETGEFLYSMVRMLRPLNVLETGTHYGIGASYMAMALIDNGKGHLDTIEFLPEIHIVSDARFQRMNLSHRINNMLMDVASYSPDKTYQLMLLDTEPQTRFAELLKFYPHLEEGGFVFIHDLHRHMHQIPNEEHGFAWPYGELPEEIKQLVREDKLRPFHFPTPRGLTGFYKPSSSDYKWNS